MSEKVINVGDVVDSYCINCKLLLANTVVAFVDGKIEKVICNTCNRKHKYRPNIPKSRQKKTGAAAKTKKAKSTTKKKTTRTRRSKDPDVKWEEALVGHDMSNPIAYSMHETFQQDDVIDHQKFGCGLIVEVREEGKMEVIFKEGTKLMVFGR